jgi:TRAP-type C4-dicarboxylate transport system substrate-binding protein
MKIENLVRSVLIGALFTFVSMASASDFRAADNQPADYPTSMAMKFMGEQIAKATNNKYNIKIFANSMLGSRKDTTEQVKIGDIEMARVSTSEFHGIIPETLVPHFLFCFATLITFGVPCMDPSEMKSFMPSRNTGISDSACMKAEPDQSMARSRSNPSLTRRA